MNILFSASVAAGLAMVLRVGWLGYLLKRREESAPEPSRFARSFAATFVAACITGLFGRWTFAVGAADGAVIGLFLWAVFASALAAGGRTQDRPAAAYWLAALPLMGAVVGWLDRLPLTFKP